jgi:hypothetical protein
METPYLPNIVSPYCQANIWSHVQCVVSKGLMFGIPQAEVKLTRLIFGCFYHLTSLYHLTASVYP